MVSPAHILPAGEAQRDVNMDTSLGSISSTQRINMYFGIYKKKN